MNEEAPSPRALAAAQDEERLLMYVLELLRTRKYGRVRYLVELRLAVVREQEADRA